MSREAYVTQGKIILQKVSLLIHVSMSLNKPLDFLSSRFPKLILPFFILQRKVNALTNHLNIFLRDTTRQPRFRFGKRSALVLTMYLRTGAAGVVGT